MENIWMWFCQKIADYYFYKGLRIGWDKREGYMLLNKYHDWIDYKFMFSKENK